jgi:lipooligosaccharide transport system permease protein
MMAVISAFGLLHFPHALLLLPVALLGGLAFGAVGMLFTALVPNIETFNLPVFLFVTPMFLFSGTFFPLENLPAWAQSLARALPLTHLVNLTRALGFGRFDGEGAWAVVYLSLFAAVFVPLALWRMQRRLIK